MTLSKLEALNLRILTISRFDGIYTPMQSPIPDQSQIGYNQDMATCSPKVRHLRYEALRRSLQDTITDWPALYQHKIIGKNEDSFKESVKAFERTFPRLNKLHSTVSRNGTYLALTYEVLARDVDEIIILWVESEELKDCIKVL